MKGLLLVIEVLFLTLLQSQSFTLPTFKPLTVTHPQLQNSHTHSPTKHHLSSSSSYQNDPSSSPIIKEFSQLDDLKDIVSLASQPLPERPDGIITVAKYSSATRQDCRATEAEYERMARRYPDTLFLRCFEEYEGADVLFGMAEVGSLPTFDVFYGGQRVGRVEGPEYTEVESLIQKYGFIVSKLDLFSEDASNERQLAWADGSASRKVDPMKTPMTTARFIPGYDWGSDKGFFDEAGDKAMESFESSYENWMPNVDD